MLPHVSSWLFIVGVRHRHLGCWQMVSSIWICFVSISLEIRGSTFSGFFTGLVLWKTLNKDQLCIAWGTWSPNLARFVIHNTDQDCELVVGYTDQSAVANVLIWCQLFLSASPCCLFKNDKTGKHGESTWAGGVVSIRAEAIPEAS